MMTKGFAATEAGGILKPFKYDLGPLGDHQVDVKVDYGGFADRVRTQAGGILKKLLPF